MITMAKKEKKQRPRTKKASLYEVSGDSLKRKSRFCPKCGPGIFMAGHKDGRHACGKCGFMEK
jgi:small subunit ribosomal protein S27Ae